jgi:hypothetical protein
LPENSPLSILIAGRENKRKGEGDGRGGEGEGEGEGREREGEEVAKGGQGKRLVIIFVLTGLGLWRLNFLGHITFTFFSYFGSPFFDFPPPNFYLPCHFNNNQSCVRKPC